jgi:cytochrome b subunit of formate dehydrogenase
MTSKEVSSNNELPRRFSVYRIVEHAVLITLFSALALTGLPQKFYYLSISQSIIIVLGGIDVLRFMHHLAGGLFTALVVQHIIINFAGVMFRRWHPTMLITFQDARDAFHNVRYYLGLDHRPALINKYSYKEKCIYWLVLLGGIQMSLTGFVLWFPVTVTKVLPGMFIPLSKSVHTSEAMLIFLLVVTWHIYDSVLSPDVFPINKSIFTGYITEEQMKRRNPPEMPQGTETGNSVLPGPPV